MSVEIYSHPLAVHGRRKKDISNPDEITFFELSVACCLCRYNARDKMGDSLPGSAGSVVCGRVEAYFRGAVGDTAGHCCRHLLQRWLGFSLLHRFRSFSFPISHYLPTNLPSYWSMQQEQKNEHQKKTDIRFVSSFGWNRYVGTTALCGKASVKGKKKCYTPNSGEKMYKFCYQK